MFYHPWSTSINSNFKKYHIGIHYRGFLHLVLHFWWKNHLVSFMVCITVCIFLITFIKDWKHHKKILCHWENNLNNNSKRTHINTYWSSTVIVDWLWVSTRASALSLCPCHTSNRRPWPQIAHASFPRDRLIETWQQDQTAASNKRHLHISDLFFIN